MSALTAGVFDHALPPLAIDALVGKALSTRAWVAFSLSGGKDSGASACAVSCWLDHIGHPRDRRIAIHADLGRAEWRSTPAMVEAIAARINVPLIVVRRPAGDMVARWEQRFESGKRRYEALETYNLIGPWSSSSLRFCTSELKLQVIGPELARRFRGETIISVIGLRRSESIGRRNTPISRLDERFARSGNTAATRMISWNPLVDWSTADILAAHARHDLPLHEAYHLYGATRLSCAFCVLASLHDLGAATDAPDNLDLYIHLVAMEADSTFSFQPQRWLADIAPALLPGSLLRDVERAKRSAGERRQIEAGMPAGLRFVKGWPPRLPTPAEATRIAVARGAILDRHRLQNIFPDGPAIFFRFAQLLDAKANRTTAH
jgi:3'-phosphoadenosine 5'-phosphosulfate sulfotransferase (PAPS reductase)/FAD synthetase